MILFLEIFIFIILLNFEVLRKITFMILVFYFLLVLEIITFIFPLNLIVLIIIN